MTFFKVCGLRDARHAAVAAEAGADFLGFVFVPGVRREISRELAREVIEEFRAERRTHSPRIVGLFADQTADEVNATISACGLDLVQLCGDEPSSYWACIQAPIMRQIKVREDGPCQARVERTLTRVNEVVAAGHIPLLDAYEPGAQGGTGRSFDWGIATEVGRRFEFVLAGGLTPANVGDAIAAANPWAVDVSTGVETDGVKDAAKITSFGRAVRSADATQTEPGA